MFYGIIVERWEGSRAVWEALQEGKRQRTMRGSYWGDVRSRLTSQAATIYGPMPPNHPRAGATARITRAAMLITMAFVVASSRTLAATKCSDIDGCMVSCHLSPNQSKRGIVNPYTA